MSCDSPFVIAIDVSDELVISESTFDLKGSYTLASYSVPGLPICAPTMSCHWGGSWGCTLKCSWGWCCCWSTPSIPVWPSIDFGASLNTPMSVASETAVSFTLDAPPDPVEIVTLTFDKTTIKLSVGVEGEDVTITLKLPAFEVYADSNGEFYTTVEIGKISSTMQGPPGISYTLSIDAQLLLCLNPKPPESWVNIQLNCTLSCDMEGIVYKESFGIACPLVAVA